MKAPKITGNEVIDWIIIGLLSIIFALILVFLLYSGGIAQVAMMGGGKRMSTLKWILLAIGLYFVISYFKNRSI